MKKIISSIILAAGLMTSPFLMADMVNLNKASAAALQENLKGVGEKKAQAIVEYREEHGDFKTIEEITEVKGIGEGIFKKIKADLSLTEGAVAVSGKAGAKGKPDADAKASSEKKIDKKVDKKVDKKSVEDEKTG